MEVDPAIVESEIRYCEQCPLRSSNYVAGLGYSNARIMVIGTAPGKIEDQTGIAFTGKLGSTVREVMEDLRVDEVYYTNVIKRRPGDRKPTPAECRKCGSHLSHEIVRNQPLLILTLGDVPLRFLLPDAPTLDTVHGLSLTLHKWGSRIEIVPTYDLGYVMRRGGLTSSAGNEWLHDCEDFARSVRTKEL